MSRNHKPREVVYAVLRYDFGAGEPEDSITVKAILWDRTVADAEVERLNGIAEDKRCRYFAQETRLFPREAQA
jgi:hypothetical protein